ncbi:VOC family protein [Sphingomicrobium arenosum]|uniref:VOC family protein n=1 Tax=Sphingomicrobium arenosum TaxID=2233861 RepID=UPI00223FF749|nr:VOC family protein [Sphingomicrobium arenosum]
MTTMIVPDYDEAVAFFTQALDFDVIEDTPLCNGKRWLVVGGRAGARLLLAQPSTDDQRDAIGRQAADRVGWFLESTDFDTDHARMTAAGVQFLEPPRREGYGTVAVFKDPFGNRWDLIEHKRAA